MNDAILHVRTALSLCLMALLLSACAGRPGPEVLNPVAASAPGTRLVTIYVATNRERSPTARNVFTSGRAGQVSYAEFTISIPPAHKPGEIEWPGEVPDPATSFVTVRQATLDEATFRSRIGAQAAKSAGEVGLFVHGYNTSLPEALYRLAQLSADAHNGAVPVLFSWPSEAALTGYVADKDAVAYSRDQLAELLTTLARERSVRKVSLAAHSMGTWLTMESLRQLRLEGRDDVLKELQVVLAAPDIDIDVFRAQASVLGPMSQPMVVLVAKDDRALAASSRLSGARERVGLMDVRDPRVQQIAVKANLRVIDISAVESSDGLRHNRFVTFAALYSSAADVDGRGLSVNKAGAFVFNAAGATLAAPFNLVGQALGGQ